MSLPVASKCPAFRRGAASRIPLPHKDSLCGRGRTTASPLLGPCAHVFVPANAEEAGPADPSACWFRLSNPLLETGSSAEIAERGKTPDKPWWQVTERHLQAFSGILRNVHLDNIEQRLWERYPQLAGEAAVQYGSVRQFAAKALEDARRIGFNTPEHEFHFLMLCLHYDCNNSPSRRVERALALAPDDPEEALYQLERALRNPSHE